jgi:SAM-dependent methyltransferase
VRPSETTFIEKTVELRRDRHSVFGAKAFELCKGFGIEVGAVNCPFDLDADVLYMDQHDSSVVFARHVNDPNVTDVLPVSFVAKRPPYDFLAVGSFDFVVASHVVEHLPNPLASIAEFIRVVKAGGIVYLVVPHKDYCFDRFRPVTPVDHFYMEYYSGVVDISIDHCLEQVFAGCNLAEMDTVAGGAAVERAKALHAAQDDFHIHTFTQDTFWALLAWLAPRVGAELVHMQWNDLNIHGALRKIRS